MELINEINQIKKVMGLNLINEATVSWLDDLFTASKSLISRYVTNKDGLEKLINNGLNDVSFSVLKKKLSTDKTLGDNLIVQLRAAKKNLSKTDPNVVLLDARIKEIKNLQPKTPKKPVTPKPKTQTPKPNTRKTGTSKDLMPNPKNNPLDIPNPNKIETSTVEDIININMKNPRFREYMVILDNADLSPKVKDLMVVAYSKVGNDPINAIKYASELSRTLNEQKYGWLKRQINRALKDPSKTITIGGKTMLAGTFWYVTVVAVLALGGAALGWIKYGTKSIPKAPEDTTTPENQGGSSTEGGEDWSKYKPQK
jgi:hypothetical protein